MEEKPTGCGYVYVRLIVADQVMVSCIDVRRKKERLEKRIEIAGLPAAICQDMWKHLRDNLVRKEMKSKSQTF